MTIQSHRIKHLNEAAPREDALYVLYWMQAAQRAQGNARFRRRTKVVSKCETMVDLSLRLYHHYRDGGGFNSAVKIVRNIFA